MIHELRQYTIEPGREADIHRLFEAEIMPLYRRHGMAPQNAWEYVPGTAHGGVDFVYTLSFASLSDRQAKWAAFFADPAWQHVRQIAGTPPPWKDVVALILRPLPYDP